MKNIHGSSLKLQNVIFSALGRISEGELPPQGGRPQDERGPQQHKEEVGHFATRESTIIHVSIHLTIMLK